MTATKEEFFNPAKLSSRDKAAATDHTARAIIAAEASQREQKTERLRQLRLEREAVQASTEAAPKRRKASSNH